MSALVRTTADPPSFMLLGGDTFHHGGELRPHGALPLPEEISLPDISPNPIPRSKFENIHPAHAKDVPFFGPNPSFSYDDRAARETIRKVQDFDADDRVFVVAAHDFTLFDMLHYLPEKANDWKQRQWKEKGRWTFLNDFKFALEN